MATNYENIAVTDFWEQIVVRGTSTENVVICDAQGNSLGKLIDGDEPITENNDGSFTLNFADGTDHTVRIKEFANTSPITFVDGVLTFSFSDGTTVTFTLKVLRDTNPITDNGDGTMTFHFNDNTTFVTPDFQAKEIVSGTGTTVGDNIVIEFERKDETNLQVIVTDARGPQGLAGFQGAYPVMVYRVGTVTSDFTGELTSTFDINSIFSQDNGTPTDWLANKSGVLADGEIYWVRSVLIDPARVDSNEMISLTWGTPYQDESGSGSGDATAGVIQYTDGSGGTRDVAQWIGTKGQYDLLTDGVKNSEILFTITNDQTEVTTASGGLYGDTQVLEYLNNNQYVGGITVGAAQINLLAGKTNADLLNTQRQFGTLNDNIAEWARGDADTALTQVPFGSTARDVASWATGASTQPITGLDGALLEPDLDPDTDATLVTTTDDAGTQTQGTVLVSELLNSNVTLATLGGFATPTVVTTYAQLIGLAATEGDYIWLDDVNMPVFYRGTNVPAPVFGINPSRFFGFLQQALLVNPIAAYTFSGGSSSQADDLEIEVIAAGEALLTSVGNTIILDPQTASADNPGLQIDGYSRPTTATEADFRADIGDGTDILEGLDGTNLPENFFLYRAAGLSGLGRFDGTNWQITETTRTI